MNEKRCPTHQETNLDIVTHVYICSAQSTNNCVNYFPNATELTFDYGFDEPDDSIVTVLNRIFLYHNLLN